MSKSTSNEASSIKKSHDTNRVFLLLELPNAKSTYNVKNNQLLLDLNISMKLSGDAEKMLLFCVHSQLLKKILSPPPPVEAPWRPKVEIF